LFQFDFLIVIRSLSNFKFVLSLRIVHYVYVYMWRPEAVDWKIGVCVCFYSL